MARRLAFAGGLGLVLYGILALMCSLSASFFGLASEGGWPLWMRPWEIWRTWPLAIISVGVALILPPLLLRGRRGLGGMLIPGVSILTTGAVLLFTSVLDWWGAWEWLWPLEVLGLAMGFLLAAIYMRVIWLIIPACILGLNGLVFQFCALTGLWDVWAVAWAIEPLAVGLALLLIGAREHRSALLTAGVVLCAVSGVMLFGTSALLWLSVLSWMGWLFRLVGPAVLILVGLALLAWGLLRGRSAVDYKVRD